uniref:SHSP domain-containing protein n=1 Tax=Solanum lycopersicum TaxID=4081 RepID=A0A3Q7ECY5_SOLLC
MLVVEVGSAVKHQAYDKKRRLQLPIAPPPSSLGDNEGRLAGATPSWLWLDVQVVDVGPPADWVKINVRATNDSFEVYALVPGLLRDELRVQSDPTGCLVITGQQHQLDNPWGVTSFKKVVTLPARIDQLRTNAVLTFHGCLHVHVPFAQQNL